MSEIRQETNRRGRLWRKVLLVLVPLPLLAGLAMALLPVTAEEGIRLEVPAIPQRFNGTAGDFNCLPASLAMALQTVDPIGLSDTDRYIEVRSNLRQLQPNLLKGLGFADAVQRVPELTDHRWSVVERGTDAQHWRQFLLDQFRQGRPVIAYINDAMRLEPAWRFPGSHAIVVTGLESGQVWYNDPWDGQEHAMSEVHFASAWGNTRLPDGRQNDGGAWYSLVFARPPETVTPTPTQTPIPTPRPAATFAPVPTIRPTDAPAVAPTIAPIATTPAPVVTDVPSTDTTISSPETARVNIEVWTCGEGESSMFAWGAGTVVDWGILCYWTDVHQTLIFTSERGEQTEVQYPQTTELWLPFGDYLVTNLTLGLETTLSMAPNDYCQGVDYCEIGWTVGIDVESPEIDTASQKSMTVSLYQCPPGMSSMTIDPSQCVASSPDLLTLSIGNAQAGLILSSNEAQQSGNTVTWSNLPLGVYNLQPEFFPAGYEAIYIPGHHSQVDGMFYPIDPEYTVSDVASTGYLIPVTLDTDPHTQIDVYVLDLYCWEGVCGDYRPGATGVQGESSVAPVNDGSDDPVVNQAIELYGGDWTGMFYQSNPSRQWPIELSYSGGDEGEVAGSIAYLPGLCSGDLIQLQLVLDFGLALREEITTGEENCISGGLFNLGRSGDELTFYWIHPDSKAVGHGRLQRTGSSQPLNIGAGSLEVHLAACPIGYAGQNYDDDCHSNGIADATVTISGPTLMALPLVTEIDAESGTGVASAEALDPGDYMLSRSAYEDALSFLYCSPDRGQTTLVSTYVDPYQVATVPIYDQAVVCDWFVLP